MNQILLFIGLVIILCLTIKPVGKKLPFPTLLIFIALGMLLGVNGPAHIDFSDYALTETVCSTALLFIMFYGGFNTNIDRAKPVAVPAVLLSTLGVVITAGITGAFAHFVLGFDWIGGLLLGSVVASTDAASVFSVLREHSLSLRGGTDSLLEVESGSNDPVAYMLTAVLATLAAGGNIDIPVLLAKQIITHAAYHGHFRAQTGALEGLIGAFSAGCHVEGLAVNRLSSTGDLLCCCDHIHNKAANN